MTTGRSRAPRPTTRRSRGRRFIGFLRDAAAQGRLPAFLLSIGLSVLAFGFLTSGDFVVRSVVVNGQSLAYADTIVAASDTLGASIFHLDTRAVAQRVAQHPAVAAADVSARFPDQVVINLDERVPVLAWQLGDRAVLIDTYGWVIAEGFDPNLPHVVQSDGQLPAVGTRIPAERVQAARYVSEQIGADLGTLAYSDNTGLTAQLQDGHTLVLGEADRMPLKLSVYSAARSIAQDWTQLDVREPDPPYYR